jgi:flagellar biosynthetic protein FlhB
MPEQTAGEKIFPATPHRRAEARKKGTVAKSMDLSGALVFLGMVITMRLAFSSGALPVLLKTDIRQAFSFNPHPFAFTVDTFSYWHIQAVMWACFTLLPILGVAFFVGIAANVAQVGLVVSLEAAAPNWERVSPAKGFERMFSMRGTAELLKGIAKMLLIGIICWTEVHGAFAQIVQASDSPLAFFISTVCDVVWAIAIKVAVLLAILAVVDYGFQKAQFEKMMRMSLQDVKQEVKQQDGDPLIKRRIRMKQREMAKNRMMHAVPTADVVITNPTHFAVALKYDPKSMSAPCVVAKGQDEIALQIKKIALESRIPLVENRPLAQALFHTVKLGKEVPPNLFRAVAEVLAYIYRIHGRRNK